MRGAQNTGYYCEVEGLERIMPQTLYETILGESFERLAPALMGIHDARPTKRYTGRCAIRGDANWAARVIARIAGLPRATADVPVEITIERKGNSEVWTRIFGTQRMHSTMENHRGRLRERLGPIVLTFELSADSERIEWKFRSARLAIVPLPITWLLTCSAAESLEDGRYTFDVSARIRGVGVIVQYKGWLGESCDASLIRSARTIERALG